MALLLWLLAVMISHFRNIVLCLPVVVHPRETCTCNVGTLIFSLRSKAAVSCHRLGDKHVTSIYAETVTSCSPVPSGSRVKKRAPHGCLLYS